MQELVGGVVQALGKGLIVNPLHYVSAALGVYIVWRLARAPLAPRLQWAATIALSVLLFAFVFVVSAPSPPFLDFTKAYWRAGQEVWRGWDALWPLYDRAYGFVNLPILAWLFAPFGLLAKWPAAIAFFVLGLIAVAVVWRGMIRAYSFTREEALMSLFLLAAFGPLAYSLREGNTSHWLLLPLFFGLMDLRAGRDVRAGALFALAVLIKPQLVILGGLAFLRGRWRVVFGGGATLAMAGLASILAYGWEAHVMWYESIVAPFASGSLPSFNAQSIASMLSRFEEGPDRIWTFEPVPLSPVARAIVLGSSLVLVAAAIWAAAPWRRQKVSTQAFEGEIMLAVLLVLVAGGLSWSHYFVWMILPAAWAWFHLRGEAGAVRARWLLAVSFILSMPAVFESWRMQLGGYEPLSWLLASHLGIGGILLFAICVMVRRRLAVTSEAAPRVHG